ncbi:MAG: hypothetical protein VW397_01205 [Candidatus Margulisiibacteriota bacterium]
MTAISRMSLNVNRYNPVESKPSINIPDHQIKEMMAYLDSQKITDENVFFKDLFLFVISIYDFNLQSQNNAIDLIKDWTKLTNSFSIFSQQHKSAKLQKLWQEFSTKISGQIIKLSKN